MTIRYYPDLEQGGDEWLAARCGLLTASEMRLIVNPPPKVETRVKKDGTPYKQREQTPAENAAARAHLDELLAQRITRYVELHYIGADMLRGHEDEIEARILYNAKYAPVTDMGFITNSRWGFTIGYSPDGLVGDDGLIEAKSRRQKFQTRTIIDYFRYGTTPEDYTIQVQTGLLVSERKWCDLISYSGGQPMITMRIYPDPKIQSAILEAAEIFEEKIATETALYREALMKLPRLIPTERNIIQEMV